jgi:aminoglycoside phosphotransferase (APT) family kinase protein
VDIKSSSAATAIVAPETRDLTVLAEQLSGWLTARLNGARDLQLRNFSYPLGAGMSHETILFDAAWTADGALHQQGMVVRIKPYRKKLYLDDLFFQQFRLMQLMHTSGQVKTARPLWFEPDAGLLGASFFVMEKVGGRVPVSYPPYSREGWLFDAQSSQRQRAWESAVRQLACIQQVSTADASFLQLPGGPEFFDQEINRWLRFFDWVDPRREQSLLRACWDGLMAKSPANRADGIVWGDARLGNMMFGADFDVVAVMDWEHPSLGGALHDLGWWLLSDMNQTVIQGLKPLPGMGTREDTIALWREVSGKSADDIDWYIALASFKMEITGVRLSSLRQIPGYGKAGHLPGSRTAQLIEQL